MVYMWQSRTCGTHSKGKTLCELRLIVYNDSSLLVTSLSGALISCRLVSLSSAASSFVVAWPLSLLSTQSMTSTLQTCLSLLRCPLSPISDSQPLLPSLEPSFSQFTFGSAFIVVRGPSSSKVYLSWVQNTAQHSMHKLSTWVNIAQQALN